MSDPFLSTTRAIQVGTRRALELSLAKVQLRVEEGPDKGLIAELAAGLCIGTGADAELRLTDVTVSRRHALLTLGPGGVTLEDLGSRNGTFADGTHVKLAIVADGARIRVGQTTIRLSVGRTRAVVFPDDEAELHEMTGSSEPMRDMFALVRQLARTDLPVLVHGETGSGKELVARALHRLSRRASRRLLVLDCGSILPELLRAELFGHEKGAFTGAEKTTPGILEEAEGGTVFLDEIGEVELPVQPNLLRALETREVCRIGSRKPVAVDFRIVAATHRDLGERVKAGAFREDLFFRLSCVTIRVPPLRQRGDDIPLLASTFARRFAESTGRPAPSFEPDALARLTMYEWPGNVRQLKTVVEAACALTTGATIAAATLDRLLAGTVRTGDATRLPIDGAALESAERETLLGALRATGWNRKAAARLLNISPTTMFAKIRKYGLKPGGT